MKIRFLVIIFIIGSCTPKEKGKLIPRKDLVPLLIDMHIADALALNHSISEQFDNLDSSLLYSSVLTKHGYSKEELISTLENYSSKPDKLIKVYDEVFSALSKKSEEAKAIRNKYSLSSLDIVWKPDAFRFVISGDTVHYPSAFEFPIDSIGTYILTASIKMTSEDKSVNPRIIAFFFSPERDVPEYRQYFRETPIPKAKYPREYTLVEECIDSTFTHMRIIIPEYDNKDTSFYKKMNISNLRVGKLKSEKEEK
ncbi:hypothetical protein ES708_05973 [subsurface metagenome]